MATKIKLMRLGKMRAPYYRIVVADARTKREGRVIETIGKYHPKENPSFIEVDSDRAQYWLGVGAQPTEPVTAILKVTGDWQRFKGLPAPGPMQVAAPRADRKAVFEAAAKEGGGSETGEKDAGGREPAAKRSTRTASRKEPAASDSEADASRTPKGRARRTPPAEPRTDATSETTDSPEPTETTQPTETSPTGGTAEPLESATEAPPAAEQARAEEATVEAAEDAGQPESASATDESPAES